MWIYPVWTRFFPHNVTVLAALYPHNTINTNTHLCAFTELLCENIFVDTLQECENLSNSVQQGRYQQMRFIFRDAIQEMLQPLAYTYLCSPRFETLNFRLTCWCPLQFKSMYKKYFNGFIDAFPFINATHYEPHSASVMSVIMMKSDIVFLSTLECVLAVWCVL